MSGFNTLESTLQPVLDAIAPVTGAVGGAVDAATQRAREVGGAILAGLGHAADALGISEDDLKQLSPELQDGVAALAAATGQLRVELDHLRSLVPRLEEVMRRPLADKLSPDSRTRVLEVVAQAARVSAAVVVVFGKMKPLIAPNPALVAMIRARFGGFYDAA